jgi:signal transduction histidine kinase
MPFASRQPSEDWMHEPLPAALILVVDDNDASRFTKVSSVKRAGYRVVEATTGQDGLRVCAELHPDVVLLDVNLPDLSGLEVCRRLKEDVTLPVQVLQVSSTSTSDPDRVRGLQAGADGYLTEPVAPEVLLATIAALLRVRRAEQAMTAAIERERMARDEAERANRFKDEFLATLSHELRTPLSAMVGWLWHLRSNITDERMRQKALDALERNTNLQVRLINDLLDVSRIGQGKVDLQIAPVDLASVVESALESVQTALEMKQISVSITTVPVTVMGDSARLQQIVVNLLTNAIKFSQQNGRVGVELTSNGDQAVIRVTDTGIGIDAALLPHVFEQFRQGEGGFARRHSGLGIGLAIVRRLVTMHGGTVEAESKGPGLGATFTVRLPATQASVRESHPPLPKDAGQPLRGHRFLVVDDDDNSRMWLHSLIEQGGGAVAAVESPHAALEYAGRHAFDLIVSDIGMPDIDGLALLKLLRAAGHQMPAVAVTAFSAAHEQENILAAGYKAYFAKPIDPSAFITKLAHLVAAAHAHDTE